MSRQPLNLTGQTYGHWTVLHPAPTFGFWQCRCSCGHERSVKGHNLRSGMSKSCGHTRTGRPRSIPANLPPGIAYQTGGPLHFLVLAEPGSAVVLGSAATLEAAQAMQAALCPVASPAAPTASLDPALLPRGPEPETSELRDCDMTQCGNQEQPAEQ